MNQNSLVEIAHLKGEKAIVTGLKVEGNGMLFACLLGFYNAGEREANHKELFFHLPGYEQSKYLPPRREGFSISGFDFCEIKILTGSLSPGDEILLHYRQVND